MNSEGFGEIFEGDFADTCAFVNGGMSKEIYLYSSLHFVLHYLPVLQFLNLYNTFKYVFYVMLVLQMNLQANFLNLWNNYKILFTFIMFDQKENVINKYFVLNCKTISMQLGVANKVNTVINIKYIAFIIKVKRIMILFSLDIQTSK